MRRRYLWLATLLSLAGALFAAACYTGFGLFVVLFVSSAAALVGGVQTLWPMVVNLAVSAAGVLFAGRLVLREAQSPAQFFQYGLGLPTCAYGLVFFLAILIASGVAWGKREDPGRRRTSL